jgi:HK97 family phage portal protein
MARRCCNRDQPETQQLGWLQKLFQGETKSFSEANWAALVDYGAQTAAGILVSPLNALRYPAVALGYNIRCETLATLALKVYRREGDTSAEATDHPLFKLLNKRPNAWTSSTHFIAQLEGDAIMHGAGFAFANRVHGAIVELIRLDPLCVTVLYDVVTLEPSYRVTLQDGSTRNYGWQDILHIPAMANGQSPIKLAREAIGLAIALERHAAKILGNGARPSGIFKSKKKLSDIAYGRLQKSWASNHTGDNAGGTVITEEDTEFQPLTFSLVDLGFNEMRNFQILEICRALEIPPTLMFELGRATYNNSETLGQSFLTFTILGRVKTWEGAIGRLLTEEEQVDYFAEFSTDTLVRADLGARYAAFAQAAGGPWLTPNEVRSLDNHAPVADGDALRPPANAVNVQANPDKPARAKPAMVAAA